MFANLELFPQEKEVYNQKVAELKSSSKSPEELSRNLAQAKENFRTQIRKYLSAAISTINSFFQCQYSIYKVGKDFDANFHVVETNVRKTRTEVIAEMEQFKQQAMAMTLSDDQIMKINIAMDVLLTYSDDAASTVDANREHFLQGAKVVATSITETPTRTNNAFEQPATPQTNFNPYANQPVQLDTGFSNPAYENKTLVDPFAGIYSGGGQASQGGVSPVPTPTPLPVTTPTQTMTMTSGQMDNSLSIFGQGMVMGGEMSSNQTAGSPLVTPVSDFDNNSGFKFFDGSSLENSTGNTVSNVSDTNLNNFQTPPPVIVPTYNPIPPANYSDTSTDTFTAYLKPESMDSVFGEEEDEKKKEILVAKEKSFLGSKILKGILIMPIVTILFFGIVKLIFWGLEKFNLLEELTGILGKGMLYAEFALCLFFALMAACVILDSIAKKTKYVSKHAIASLTLFSVVVYGLTFLSPNISDMISHLVDFESAFQIFLYYSSCLVFAFFVGTFTWLFSFLRTEKELIKRKLNIVEIVASIWLLYTLVLPAISVGTAFIGIEIVSEKTAFLYDYSNADIIIIVASFILFLGLSFFSKREEEFL